VAAVHLPPGPSTPRAVQGVFAVAARLKTMRRMRERYGSAFRVNIPIFGDAVVISDPAEVRQLFTTNPEIADNVEVNLGRVLGPGSFFALEGEAHKKQRKMLVPPFHGRRLQVYEALIEEEAVREMASWPEGREFATLQSMMRITLNAILRAVFGAEGAEFETLRELLPRFVKLGSQLAVLPIPRTDLGVFTPWGRFNTMRREYDAVVDRLIDKAERDTALDERNDVLALMLQARYDDGSGMTRSEIADQLLTLLTAGHETTATTLAWAVERLRRHPVVLRRLVEEVDTGGSELREATILEVQRVRPVIDATARQVRADTMQLGRWTLPKGQTVIASIYLMHDNDELFPNAHRFDPDRFVGVKPDMYGWIPFGGGARRCIGAAFAHMEMNVVLRTMLRDFALEPTTGRDERWHSRGVAFAPRRGGRAVVHRRRVRPITPTHAVDVAVGA
jgi:cytochrome P450